MLSFGSEFVFEPRPLRIQLSLGSAGPAFQALKRRVTTLPFPRVPGGRRGLRPLLRGLGPMSGACTGIRGSMFWHHVGPPNAAPPPQTGPKGGVGAGRRGVETGWVRAAWVGCNRIWDGPPESGGRLCAGAAGSAIATLNLRTGLARPDSGMSLADGEETRLVWGLQWGPRPAALTAPQGWRPATPWEQRPRRAAGRA